VQIDRILALDMPENHNLKKKTNGAENPVDEFGIVMDRANPDFEMGTGRQFLIKWCNTPYSDSTYEFERDLIINEVDYREHLEAFEKRSRKVCVAEILYICLVCKTHMFSLSPCLAKQERRQGVSKDWRSREKTFLQTVR
jgi:hypothetical protein